MTPAWAPSRVRQRLYAAMCAGFRQRTFDRTGEMSAREILYAPSCPLARVGFVLPPVRR